jgi:hypothetical protein
MLRYRTKLRLKKALRFLLITLGVLLVAIVGILVYTDALITYDENGAHFNGQLAQTEATLATEPRPVVENPIILEKEQEASALTIKELGGYYITTSMLLDLPAVISELESMEEAPGTLLFEMKSIYGNFYYDTDISGTYTSSADIDKIESLIAGYAKDGKTYLAARIPAFTDNNFALDNQS